MMELSFLNLLFHPIQNILSSKNNLDITNYSFLTNLQHMIIHAYYIGIIFLPDLINSLKALYLNGLLPLRTLLQAILTNVLYMTTLIYLKQIISLILLASSSLILNTGYLLFLMIK